MTVYIPSFRSFGRNVVERHLSSASYFVFQIPDLQSAVSMNATLWSVFHFHLIFYLTF